MTPRNRKGPPEAAFQSLPEPARACQSLPEPARACQSLPEPARACLPEPPRACQSLPELPEPARAQSLPEPESESLILRAFWVQGRFLPEVLFRPLARSTRQFFPQLSLFLKHVVLPVRMLLGQIPRRFPYLTGRFQLYSKITTIRVLRTLQRFRRRTSPMAAKS